MYIFYKIYPIPEGKALNIQCVYDTKNKDSYYLKDITNNEYVRIPWSNPSQRDLAAFIKGYRFGKGQKIEFEKIQVEDLSELYK